MCVRVAHRAHGLFGRCQDFSLVLCKDLRKHVSFTREKQGRQGYDTSNQLANEKAFQVLAGSHPSLADVQKWAGYFQSRVGYDMQWSQANDKAFELLQGSPPDMNDVKSWAEYFASRKLAGGRQHGLLGLGL